MSMGSRLREALRDERVIPVLGIPTAAHARIMQEHGTEVGFIGTSLTMGNYTGLPDTGVVTFTEGVQVARWVTKAVDFPIIFDGDTGHGGEPALRRLVEECIDAGLAGLRVDDQRLETKRSTLDPGILIEERDDAIRKYEAIVRRRDELDPDFVVIAQCYARNAANGGEHVYLDRLSSYADEAGVDWVNFECPCSLDEVRAAREAVSCGLSVMQGRLAAMPTIPELAELGIDMAWYTNIPDRWIKASAWEAMKSFAEHGYDAWTSYCAEHPDNPYTVTRRADGATPSAPPAGAPAAKLVRPPGAPAGAPG